MPYALGIDVGTTFTAAAVWRDERVEVVALEAHRVTVPTVIAVEGDELRYGSGAISRGIANPDSVAREFKRRLGDSIPIFLAGAPYSADRLVALFARWVYDTVVAQTGETPSSVAVTHPANWTEFQRHLLSTALDQAGVPSAALIPEPQAATIDFGSVAHMEPGQLVLVYDLGGGTFDVALLQRDAEGFTSVGVPAGVERLGGIDFDEAVFEHVLGYVPQDIIEQARNDPTGRLGLAQLRARCVEAKESLSSDVSVDIPVLLPGLSSTVRLTRHELEDMVRPMLRQTIELAQQALDRAQVSSEQLSAVLLVGGSSRIPLVSELVGSALGAPVRVDAHPKLVVARGAARWVATQPGSTAPPPPSRRARPVASIIDDDDEERPSRRRVMIAGIVAVVLVAGGILAWRLASSSDEPSAKPTTTAVSAAESSEPATSSTTSTSSTSSTSSSGGTTTSPPTSTVAASIKVPVSARPAADDVILFGSLHEGTTGWDIDAIGADGAPARPVIATPGTEFLPAWSPDRGSFAYSRPGASGTAWELTLATAEGKDSVVATDELRAETRAAWSPDGTMLAFESERGGAVDMYLLNLQDGQLIQVTDDEAFEGDPGWSPDGQQIVFWRAAGAAGTGPAQAGEGRHLYKLQIGGSNLLVPGGPDPVVTQLTDGEGEDWVPSFSPDGATILFASLRDGNYDVYSIPASGGDTTRLTDDPNVDTEPAWSPDGRRFVFRSQRDGDADAELYVANADGSDQRRLSNPVGGNVHPAWGAR
jgi:actin-like ATPase involved in cell morphogenesis/cytoskeletal protein RodZ